ncbi:cupin-like domain-containing protein [Altererythrobacter indicus]|uniref:Cupin-like domain-containing protein n=2 Tax=Altericroceibacterium indicum TaxID=374177 RepID=A0A845A967_9SPHN|nr:cupin-like domain-containing protein [Altericroceibacterium indicum]
MEYGQPKLLRGVCKEWPVVQAAQSGAQNVAAYLQRFDSGAQAQAFIGAPDIQGRYHYGDNAEGFNFRRETLSLPDALATILRLAQAPGEGTAYLGSIPTRDYLPGFEQENSLPFLSANVEPRVWVGNASTASCHYDTFDNVACVAAGKRRFTLYPPEAIADLYIGPIDHTMAGQPISMAMGSTIGDPRYPRFEAIRDEAIIVELEPGDALYLPKLWWHQVEATEPFNLLVNYWWDGFPQGPDTPFTAMMLAMTVLAERPAAERQAWRAFFDHYVFRPNGHPLSHMPDERHGILGPLGNGNRKRIRAMVMQWLRGS